MGIGLILHIDNLYKREQKQEDDFQSYTYASLLRKKILSLTFNFGKQSSNHSLLFSDLQSLPSFVSLSVFSEDSETLFKISQSDIPSRYIKKIGSLEQTLKTKRGMNLLNTKQFYKTYSDDKYTYLILSEDATSALFVFRSQRFLNKAITNSHFSPQPFQNLLTFSVLLFVLLTIILVNILIHYKIAPVRKLIEDLKNKEATTPGFQLKVPHTNDEVEVLTAQFNQTFDLLCKNLELESLEWTERVEKNLEKTVAERTRDISLILEKISKIKKEQDADYYLFWRLVTPLIDANLESKLFSFTGAIEQQKKFSYNRNPFQIGGDINIAKPLTLGGKPYIAFLNADVMGKSLQGAVGAIIIAIVFNQIIKQINESNAKKTPDAFLTECFSHFRSIFLPFNDNLYTSCIAGLADDSSGEVTYFNAEHPWGVLYRDGEATFLERELTLHKLGMVENEKIVLHRIATQPGDKILFGSDGKDDIKIEEIMNNDEGLFLSVVEYTKGDVFKIQKELTSIGTITDDFSILSIARKNEG